MWPRILSQYALDCPEGGVLMLPKYVRAPPHQIKWQTQGMLEASRPPPGSFNHPRLHFFEDTVSPTLRFRYSSLKITKFAGDGGKI